jgi:hypothetical protein
MKQFSPEFIEPIANQATIFLERHLESEKNLILKSK